MAAGGRGSWELGFGARECRHIYVGGEWNWEDQGTPDKICNSIAYIFLICMQLRVVRSIRTTKHLGLAHISLESALSRLGARELSFFLKLNIAFYIWNLLDNCYNSNATSNKINKKKRRDIYLGCQ